MFDLSDFLKDILSSLIGPPGVAGMTNNPGGVNGRVLFSWQSSWNLCSLWIHMNSMAALVLGMVFAFWLIAYIIVQSLRNHDYK